MTDTTLFPDLPPAPPPAPMTRERLESVLRAATTYDAGGGTSGWLLTEGQFAGILAAADEYLTVAVLRLARDLDDLGLITASALAREFAYAKGAAL